MINEPLSNCEAPNRRMEFFFQLKFHTLLVQVNMMQEEKPKSANQTKAPLSTSLKVSSF